MGEYLRCSPSPVIGVYGALDESSASHRLACLLESNHKNNRLKTLKFARDHALPLKKMRERKYDTDSTSSSILKPDWTRKHQEEIPGGLLICVETIQPLNQSCIESACSLLDSVRANVQTSGRVIIPISLAILVCNTTLDNPLSVEEDRQFYLQALKKHLYLQQQQQQQQQQSLQSQSQQYQQTLANSIAILYASDLDSNNSSNPILIKLGLEIVNSLFDYYHLEIARIKQVKSTSSSNLMLKSRLDFKCAQFYEMRSMFPKALLHYQQSYQSLSELCSSSSNNNTSSSLFNIRSAAEFVHYRMGALRFQNGEMRMALAQLKTHLQAMQQQQQQQTDEYWEWMSRQHVLFSGLLSSTSQSNNASNNGYVLLDQVERERMTIYYHLSRAALFASRIKSKESTRALELFERLFSISTSNRKRRETCQVLFSIAKERCKLGDLPGSLRDFQRILDSPQCREWPQSLFVRILAIGEAQQTPLLALTKNVNNAPFIAMFDIYEESRVQAACHFLLNTSLQDTSLFLQAFVDQTTSRLLLINKLAKQQDVAIKSIRLLKLANNKSLLTFSKTFDKTQEERTPFSNILGNFLLVELDQEGTTNQVDENNLATSAFHNKSTTYTLTITLANGSTGGDGKSVVVEWNVSNLQVVTPHEFEQKHSSLIFAPASSNEEEEETASSLKQIHQRQQQSMLYQLVLASEVPKQVFIGETISLEFTILPSIGQVAVGASTATKTPSFDFVCECDTLRIHNNKTSGKGHFEIEITETYDQHVAILVCIATPTTTMSSTTSTPSLLTMRVEFHVSWAIRIGLCKSLLPTTVGQQDLNNFLVELECMAAHECSLQVHQCNLVNTTLDNQLLVVEEKSMIGLWQFSEQRNLLVQQHQQHQHDSNFGITFSLSRCNIPPTVFSFSLPITPPQSSPIHSSTTDDAVIAQETFTLHFEPNLPFVRLGQEIDMTLRMKTCTVSSISIADEDVSMSSSGFLICGQNVQSVQVFNRMEEMEFKWILVAQRVGPCQFPGVWLDTVDCKRKRIDSIDRNCLVLAL